MIDLVGFLETFFQLKYIVRSERKESALEIIRRRKDSLSDN